MSAIHTLVNEVAVSIVLVSSVLFIAQKALHKCAKKWIALFILLAFFLLLVPFTSFSVSGYVYALLGSPSVLLVIMSIWSGWQIFERRENFQPFFDIKSKIVIFLVGSVVYAEFLGGIFSINYHLPSQINLYWLDFYHLDSFTQMASLWVFAIVGYFVSARLGLGLVCGLFAYKILGEMGVWDYCIDPFLWLWCGVSVLYAVILKFIKSHKTKLDC